MRAINVKNNDSDTFNIVHKGDEELRFFTFTLANGLVEITAPDKINITDDWYKVNVDLNELSVADKWLIYKWGNFVEFIPVGEIDVVSWVYIGETGKEISFKQIKIADGTELKNATMTELGYGIYYAEPEVDKSICIINDNVYATLSVPYIVVNVNDNSGSSDSSESDTTLAAKNFINVGYNMFGFQGNRYSYYDLDQGKWVDSDSKEAKASDLAKAVCKKYGLVWDNKNDDNFIGNYIKYIRSYDENAKKYRYYKPFITPENNDANFALVQTDEDGNKWIRGVSIFLKQNLETINDTDGAIVTFKEG